MFNQLLQRCAANTGARVCFILTLALIANSARAGLADTDGDGVADPLDNCVLASNATQVDTDGDGWGNRCDADFNDDGITNAIDLGIFKANFFTTNPLTDLNADGITNAIDLGLFKAQFFGNPGPAGYANWINTGSGDWDDPNNWFPAAVPPPEAHVFIDQPADLTVYFPTETGGSSVSLEAASIMAGNDLQVRTATLTISGDVTSSADVDIIGGTFDVGGTLAVDGALNLVAAGRLASATVAPNGSGDDLAPTGNGARLRDVTLQRDLVVNNTVQIVVEDGLTLDNVDVIIASTGSFAYLRFDGTQTFGGSGTVRFAGTTGVDSNNRLWSGVGGETVTIEAGIDIDTDTRGGYVGASPGDIVLLASVTCDAPDRSITFGGNLTVGAPVTGSNGCDIRLRDSWTNLAGNTIAMTGGGRLELDGDWENFGTISVADGDFEIGDGVNDDWSNSGTINIVNTPADIGGVYLTADLVSINSDGPLLINGTVQNGGTDLDVDLLPAGSNLGVFGRIEGGTVSGSIPLTVGPSANGARLVGVTMNTELFIANTTQLVVEDGLTLNNADITLNSTGGFSYVRFDTTQTLGGSGRVLFAGSTGNDTQNRIWQNGSGQTLTIGSGITVKSDSAGGRVGSVPGSITLQGSVVSDLLDRRVEVRGDLSLQGTVSASGGADLRIDDSWVNEAGNTISMAGGGLLDLDGDWNNLGTITVTDSEVSTGGAIADTWTNSGSITFVNSPARIGGSFDTANLTSIVTDSTINIEGDLDNQGSTFNLDVFPAGVALDSTGIIDGGTIDGSANLTAGPGSNGGDLVGVTLSTGLDVLNASQVIVTDGLTLDDSDITLTSDGSFCYLRFDGTQTLGGDGKVFYSGSTGTDSVNRVWQNTNGETLTIAAGITLDTDTTGGYLGVNPGTIDLFGSVISDVPGRLLRLGGTLNIAGSVASSNGGELRIQDTWNNAAGNTISATNAGLLELAGDWTNDGDIIVTGTEVDVGGNFTTAQLLSITSDGNLDIDGVLDNTGTTLDLDAIPNGITLINGSEIVGGTVTGSSPLTLGSGQVLPRLDGVTLSTDLLISNNSQAIIDNGLTLASADVRLASDGALAYLRFDGAGTQTLSGTGEVRFEGAAGGDTTNRIFPQSGGTQLSIASGITLRTVTTGGYVGSNNGSMLVQGAIISDQVGRTLNLQGTSFDIEGSATVADGADIALINNGAAAMGASADLDIEIGPTTFGSLDFNDSIAFDGDLNLALVGGASPSACDLYDVITYESFSGSFANVTGPDLGGGQTFDVLYLEDAAQLQAPGSGCVYEVSRITGNTESASSDDGSNVPPRGNDNALNTYWCATSVDAAPQYTVELPADATVASIVIDNGLSASRQFLTARLRLLNAADAELYDSGVVSFTSGDIDHDVSPDTSGVRKIVVEGVTFGVSGPCIGELDALGTQP